MATHEDCNRLLHRVTRDLQAPMALLTSALPHQQIIDHTGFEDAPTMRSLAAVDAHCRRSAGDTGLDAIRSWAAAPVERDGIEVGTLLVADRRRRWFDDEELRHLGLLTFAAEEIIATVTSLEADTMFEVVDVSEIDVRKRALVGSLG